MPTRVRYGSGEHNKSMQRTALRAAAMKQEKGPALPWWRMTKSGKPYDQLPGGAEQHSALIASEQNSKSE